MDADRTLQTLAGLAAEASERLAGLSSPHEKVAALNDYVFEELGFQSVSDPRNPDHLYLDRVLRGRRGYCTSLVLVYLEIARELGLPVFPAATPHHVFLRYDDGKTRINIETVEGGREVLDETYRRRHRISPPATGQPIYLKNLTDDEFLSTLVNNMGVLRSLRKQIEAADELYREALQLDPLNATAIYNMARDTMRRNDCKDAIGQFSRVLSLNPGHIESLNNRGICFAKLENVEAAKADFEAALAVHPGFTEARRNLDSLQAVGAPGDGR